VLSTGSSPHATGVLGAILLVSLVLVALEFVVLGLVHVAGTPIGSGFRFSAGAAGAAAAVEAIVSAFPPVTAAL